MPKPKPVPAGRPSVPLPAHTATGRHPLDPPPTQQQPLIEVTEPAGKPAGSAPRTTSKKPVTSRRHDVTTSPKQRKTTKRSTAPVAADAVAFTLRMTPSDAADLDEWVLSLRRDLGRTRLDKSEVLRALLTLARDRPDLRKALLDSLSEQ